ncbi:hypothetical protein [Massilia scottii]|uniref:hypothetical protein n=1 Tax=Massilia scottii TaxID=3057166 RepID=UPI0027966A7D|nr:hypothetical protein [Massilia sp. CCM 9029]MDQ1831592.1 hypothetical protein [Massilia sp. CCM 9029]
MGNLSGPVLESNKFSKILGASSGISSVLKDLHDSLEWKTSLHHARGAFDAANIANQFIESQKAYSQIKSEWELPRHLVESVGALTALEAQIGRITVPVIDWNSAAVLASHLSRDGLLMELAALGIDENGELTLDSVATGDDGYLSPKARDLSILLGFIVTFLIFSYQEFSSGKWEARIDGKIDSQIALAEKHAKQLQSLSILVEKAIIKEAARKSTRFVVLHRDVAIRRQPQSGTPVDSWLLPREVVTLVSEQGKWIEVRYYHWVLRKYQTGWALKNTLREFRHLNKLKNETRGRSTPYPH